MSGPTRAAPGGRVLTPLAAARLLPCPLCGAAVGSPCQQLPSEGDHLARYAGAYADGRISRPDMTAVFDAAEVITKWRIIPAAAAS